jgi:hypothetical protein
MSEPSPKTCTSWDEVTEAFKSFPHQKLGYTNDGDLRETLWVFRGHKSAEYSLKPTIERETEEKPVTWVTLESKILEEFQARARMHLNSSDLPIGPDEKLGWLSLMQHYGVPTRLLDFTLSPYVALYFSLCNRTDLERRSPAEVWAIDAGALVEVAKKASREADREEAEHARKKASTTASLKTEGASLDPRFAATDGDLLLDETVSQSRIISNALSATGIRRAHFIERGFVTLAMPPIQNRRLSSQQGAFLFSGAESLSFHDSLFRMMDGKANWYKRFQIANDAKIEMDMERRLFERNIHHLSLFPDMEGLAGFIRQKTRLHWVPADNPLLEQA